MNDYNLIPDYDPFDGECVEVPNEGEADDVKITENVEE